MKAMVGLIQIEDGRKVLREKKEGSEMGRGGQLERYVAAQAG